VQTDENLRRLAGRLRRTRIASFALDLEAENNLHRYGIHLCLIQLTAFGKYYLVDPLAVEDLGPLLGVFRSAAVEKVMYSAEEDVKLLKHTHGTEIRNIFDVQLAARMLDMDQIAMDALVQNVLGESFSKRSKLQKSDWCRRPLSEAQLIYASNDIRYLAALKAELQPRLAKRGLQEEYAEAIGRLEAKEFRTKSRPHMRIKGAFSLSREQQVRLKHLFEARDAIARELDYPAFRVIKNATLIRLSRKPPRTAGQWIDRDVLAAPCRSYVHLLVEAVSRAERENADAAR